jgi:hypothetical protein
VQQHSMRPGDTANLGNGLERTHLVIGVHNANQQGLRGDGFADGLRVDPSRSYPPGDTSPAGPAVPGNGRG